MFKAVDEHWVCSSASVNFSTAEWQAMLVLQTRVVLPLWIQQRTARSTSQYSQAEYNLVESDFGLSLELNITELWGSSQCFVQLLEVRGANRFCLSWFRSERSTGTDENSSGISVQPLGFFWGFMFQWSKIVNGSWGMFIKTEWSWTTPLHCSPLLYSTFIRIVHFTSMMCFQVWTVRITCRIRGPKCMDSGC